ncbi:MAG: biopolymer transporter ExbD [Elusimicrobia bacterium]|nr:biopolymer transporter ExbD [Elusimicrobiota bacterium]
MNDPGMDGEMEETEKINVVPLADLTLVLLIILMVISPMISQSLIRVSTPQVKTGAGAAGPEAKKEEGPLRVDIRENGFLLNGEPFEFVESMLEDLKQRLLTNPERSVLVSADERVVVRQVVQVLDGAKLAGAKSLSLLGLKKKEQEKIK